ncbi:MAG: sulfotransferase domain-containing protein [Kiritimatiellae bacterium]|nr:sulfotransferase domain-containing protein [Kiritimatiellia bacterium]
MTKALRRAGRSVRARIRAAVGRRKRSAPHPWFAGFVDDDKDIAARVPSVVPRDAAPSADLSAPVLFLAAGHSGTTPLTRVLEQAGVYIGNREDPDSLNPTYDSLYWAYGFERTLVPKLWRQGQGCELDPGMVTTVGLACLRRHLSAYRGGPWGFKTCCAMFGHALYRFLFPHARYIHLVRDGRDLVLSGNGYLYLTKRSSRKQHWHYFKIITFGLSDDIASCPFPFPDSPGEHDPVMENRFWIAAKWWKEHVRMMEHLRANSELSPQVHTVRYEELCGNPVPVLADLFRFLDVEFTESTAEFARSLFYTTSIGRWKEWQRHVSGCSEDMDGVFAGMRQELESLGYEA